MLTHATCNPKRVLLLTLAAISLAFPTRQAIAVDPVVSATVNIGLTPSYSNLTAIQFTLLSETGANNVSAPVAAINEIDPLILASTILFPNTTVLGKSVVAWAYFGSLTGITSSANPLFTFDIPITNGNYPRFTIDRTAGSFGIIGTPGTASADNFVVTTAYHTQAGLTQYFLNASFAGIGSGSVNSLDSQITCTSNCSAIYNNLSPVTLTSAAGTDSYFFGWSGGGCTGTGNCAVTMDNEKTVTANFDIHPPVNLDSAYYPLILTAYKAAGMGNVNTVELKIRRSDITESPVFANDTSAVTKDLNVTLTGGLDGIFATAVGNTNIHGAVTISVGSVTVNRIVIM